MIQGSGRWAVVGIRSAMKAAVSPPLLDQHRLVERARGPGVSRTEIPGSTSRVALQQPPAVAPRRSARSWAADSSPGCARWCAGRTRARRAAPRRWRWERSGRTCRRGSFSSSGSIVVLPPAWSKCRWVLMTQRTSRGQEAGGRERVLQLGGALEPGVLDPVDVEELAGPPCCPAPVSISTSPSGCSTSRQRMASGIRCRSSGATRVSQSVRGTTPNMAPPSSRWRPPSSVWQRSPPTWNDCARSVTPAPPGSESARGSVGHGQPLPPAPGASRRRARSRRGPAACGRPPRAPAAAAGASSSAVTSASPAARCRAGFSKPKCWVRLSSPQERTPFTSRRASRTVQSRGPSSARSRARRTSALTKFQSNRALWATNTRPASAASTWSATSAKRRRVAAPSRW